MGLCLSSKQHPAKKITAYAHLIRSVGPFIMHNEDIFFGPLIGASGFVFFTIK